MRVRIACLLAVLGAASLAVGLALQGALSNVAAGVMLLILRPYRVGDVVRTTAGHVGTIREVLLEQDPPAAYVVIHGEDGGSGDYELDELTILPDGLAVGPKT